MRTRKVAIVLPSLQGGGAERVSVYLANALVARGYAVDVVVMHEHGALRPLLAPQVNVIALHAERLRAVVLPLTRYLQRARPDGVVANMWPLSVIAVAARALARTRCRILAVEHNAWSLSPLVVRRRRRLLIKATMRSMLPRADIVAAVSNAAARDLESFAGLEPQSVHTLYNPVIGLTPPRPSVPPEKFRAWASGPHKRILAVGALKEEKDYPLLLRAFAELRNHLDARLLILGEGAERAALEASIQALDLSQSVQLGGFALDTATFYAHADLCVLSSFTEGLPTVLIEALSHGVPCVSTDCPTGPREILRGGALGRLVPVGDAAALTAAMRESLQAKHDHQALEARAHDFSIDVNTERYLALLFPA